MKRVSLVLTVAVMAVLGLGSASTTDAQEYNSTSMREAAELLAKAGSADDKVAAYTEVVQAYEAGLANLRADLRETELQRRTLEGQLENSRHRLDAILSGLFHVEADGLTQTMHHPAGPVDGIRAGMLLASISPKLQEDVTLHSSLLEEQMLLLQLQSSAAALLETSLGEARMARTNLSVAISERRASRVSSATDLAAMQALLNSADTLDGFADSLSGSIQSSGEGIATSQENSSRWTWPSRGEVLHNFGDRNLDGDSRTGLTLAVPSTSLVVSPSDATVRYAGPLLDFGQVAILEASPGVLIVLGGLNDAMVAQGDIVARGDAIGWMSGPEAENEQILSVDEINGGQVPLETLYIEVRQGRLPVDPMTWLRAAADTGNGK